MRHLTRLSQRLLHWTKHPNLLSEDHLERPDTDKLFSDILLISATLVTITTPIILPPAAQTTRFDQVAASVTQPEAQTTPLIQARRELELNCHEERCRKYHSTIRW